MQQAADVRLADSEGSFDAGLGKEAGIETEFDAELVADLVVKLRRKANERHRNGRKLPLGAVVFPKIPGGVNFAGAVFVHEFAGRFEEVLGVGSGDEFAFEQGRLNMFQGVYPEDRAPFGKLRVGEQREHSAEMPQHVRFVVTGNPAGEIESVWHDRALTAIVARTRTIRD